MPISSLLVCIMLALAVVLSAGPAWAQTPAPEPVKHRMTLPASPTPEPSAPGSVQFIATATALIGYLGLTILTDPNVLHKGDSVHCGYGLHGRRLTEPALSMAQLPPPVMGSLPDFAKPEARQRYRDGQDAVDMLGIIAPAMAIPVHYDEYDVFASPLSQFEQAVRQAGLEHKVHHPRHGGTDDFGATHRCACDISNIINDNISTHQLIGVYFSSP